MIGIIGFCDYPGIGPKQAQNPNKLQNQIRLHHQNMTLGIGKTVTESNMSQNQIVTKSNNDCIRGLRYK